MAAWNFDRFQREVSNGNVVPVYCLYGEETYLIEESLKQLLERGLDGAPKDFNVDIFYAGDSEITAVKDAVEMLPMMAPRRFVVLKSVDSMKTKDFDDLLSLVESPIDSSVLILVAEKVDLRKKFFKSIEKNGALVKFDRLTEQQLPHWINLLAKKLGKNITQEAVLALAQLVGANLLDVNNELQKLSQFVGSREVIDESDVREIVSHSRMESVFGLTNAIGDRDRAKALTFLANLLEHDESEVGILALISRHMRILLSVKEAHAQGLSRTQIASRVGVPSFFIQNYIEQSNRWTEAKLEETLSVLLETDRALKSSPVSSHIWLENFIIKVT